MSDQKKKNWFMRHKVVTGIAVLIAFFIMLGSMGSTPEPVSSQALTLEQKQEVFYKVTEAEDKGMKEAQATYPTDPMEVTDNKQLLESVEQNAELTTQLQEQYKQEVLSEYELSEEEWQTIMLEGVNEDWPTPEL